MKQRPSGGESKIDGMCRQHETVKNTAKIGSSLPNSGNEKTLLHPARIVGINTYLALVKRARNGRLATKRLSLLLWWSWWRRHQTKDLFCTPWRSFLENVNEGWEDCSKKRMHIRRYLLLFTLRGKRFDSVAPSLKLAPWAMMRRYSTAGLTFPCQS